MQQAANAETIRRLNINMLSVSSQNFTGSQISYDSNNRNKETAQNVATGVGVTGYATRYASKRGILGSMLEKSNRAVHIASKNSKEANTLLGRFWQNSKRYSGDIMRGLAKHKNNRYIAAIIKNPLAQKAASALGGVMAFFVLITGIRQSVETGKLAINDTKNKCLGIDA